MYDYTLEDMCGIAKVWQGQKGVLCLSENSKDARGYYLTSGNLLRIERGMIIHG